MDAIETISGPVSHLDRANVDTDQIMPKQFLKRVERTGFGEFLFYDWAQGARLGPAGQPDPRRRRELRLRLIARARAVGPAGLRLPGDRRAELRRHLLLELHEDRAAAGRARRGGLRGARGGRRGRDRPRAPGGPLRRTRGPFAIDEEIRRRLLAGLDDIGVTLVRGATRIADYEAGARAQRAGDDSAVRLPIATALGRRDLRRDAALPQQAWARRRPRAARGPRRADARVLDVGCGTGRVTERDLRARPRWRGGRGRRLARDGRASPRTARRPSHA